MGWIGIDLDGTLAKQTDNNEIGEPVTVMFERVQALIKANKHIKIFTARAETNEGKEQVKKWLAKHGIGQIEVTNIKDGKMIELWDNRAIRINTDKGTVCGCCKHFSVLSASGKFISARFK